MDKTDTLLFAAIVADVRITATILNLEEPPRQFENTIRGVEQVESWIYKRYRYPQEVKLCIWESVNKSGSSAIMDKVQQGTILKPRLFNFKRIKGLVEVGYMPFPSALRLSEQFGYKTVTLEAASRWCRGEVPKSMQSSTNQSP